MVLCTRTQMCMLVQCDVLVRGPLVGVSSAHLLWELAHLAARALTCKAISSTCLHFPVVSFEEHILGKTFHMVWLLNVLMVRGCIQLWEIINSSMQGKGRLAVLWLPFFMSQFCSLLNKFPGKDGKWGKKKNQPAYFKIEINEWLILQSSKQIFFLNFKLGCVSQMEGIWERIKFLNQLRTRTNWDPGQNKF